jgi:hypothetical protein
LFFGDITLVRDVRSAGSVRAKLTSLPGACACICGWSVFFDYPPNGFASKRVYVEIFEFLAVWTHFWRTPSVLAPWEVSLDPSDFGCIASFVPPLGVYEKSEGSSDTSQGARTLGVPRRCFGPCFGPCSWRVRVAGPRWTTNRPSRGSSL